MIIKCISSNPNDAKKSHKYTGSSTGNNSGQYLLTVGKEYNVLSIYELPHKSVLYLIIDDASSSWKEITNGSGRISLNVYDSSLFEVLSAPSEDWQTVKGTPYTFFGKTILYREFAKDKHFIKKAIEGDLEAVSTIHKYLNT